VARELLSEVHSTEISRCNNGRMNNNVISNVVLEGGCLRLVFRSLFWIEVQENLMHNVLREVEILSKGWL